MKWVRPYYTTAGKARSLRPAGFEQGGEVAALPHLRDLQL